MAASLRTSPAERTARETLRYARGDVRLARASIEAAIASAGRASTPRVRAERLAEYRAALVALDEMTRES